MMTAKNKEQTAEQKLLKMIEANAGDDSDGGQGGSGSGKSGRGGFLSIIKTINFFLLVGIVCSIAFLVVAVKIGMDGVAKEVKIELEGSDGPITDFEATIPEPKRLAHYTAPLDERYVFAPYQTKKTVIAEDPVSDQMLSLADAYRLVGIAWFDTADSASAMIEDKEQNITHFLQKGEKIGNINVKTIYADSVLLGYENEEIIIRYDTPQP